MESWQMGLIGNAVIMVAYLAIAAAIVVPLARSHQLKSNPLGAATAATFFTCAVHHGAHAVHMVLPSLGVNDPQGLAVREAWGWPQEAIAASIDSASRTVTGLLGSKLGTLDLLRSSPAEVGTLDPAFQKISDEINETAARATLRVAADGSVAPDRTGR